MKNIFEVLKQKEDQLTELKHQIYNLRAVVPLLAEDSDPKPQPQPMKEFP